jgi:hypothetical protein
MQGETSTRLGFTDSFRVELAWARLLGAVLSLAPVGASEGVGIRRSHRVQAKAVSPELAPRAETEDKRQWTTVFGTVDIPNARNVVTLPARRATRRKQCTIESSTVGHSGALS